MTDWEPLAASDPIPGDPTVSANAGTYYSGIATDMSRAYAALGVIGDLDGFESQALEALRGKADDVRSEVVKAQGRYAAAGKALSGYSVHHQEAKDAAAALLVKVQAQQTAVDEANRHLTTAQTGYDSAVTTAQHTGTPVDTEVSSTLTRAQTAHGEAVSTLNGLIGDLPAILTTLRQRAHDAAKAIDDAVGADGLKDGWWEHWGSKLAHFVSEWAGKISLWAGVASLLLGWVPILGQIIAVVALVATVAALVADIALLAEGEGDWLTVILDVVGLISLGAGKVVGDAGKGLAAKGLSQGASRSSRVAAKASRFGSPANRAAARTVWKDAAAGMKAPTTTRLYNPGTWFKSGWNSFSGLGARGKFMTFLGQGDGARTYQMLQNANRFDKFAKNATAYPKTMRNLGSFNPLQVGSLGSAIVPYTLTAVGVAVPVTKEVMN